MKAAQTVIGLGLVLLFPHCNRPEKAPPIRSDGRLLERDVVDVPNAPTGLDAKPNRPGPSRELI